MEILKDRESFYRATHWNGAQTDYLEALVNSNDERDQIVAARMGYGLDRLLSSDSVAVRQAVALAGYGLDVLCKDESEVVRQAVAENLSVVNLRPEILNILLEDDSIGVKCILIDNGVGLDKFMKDENSLIRAYVAETGYGAETLRFDVSSDVRASVAKALPQIYKENPLLGEKIASQFVDDLDWYVRACLAETGYRKDILACDSWGGVRAAAGKSEGKIEVGSKVVDDDTFRGEVTRVHESGMFYVSHEVVNGRKVAADGWYPPERLRLDTTAEPVLLPDAVLHNLIKKAFDQLPTEKLKREIDPLRFATYGIGTLVLQGTKEFAELRKFFHDHRMGASDKGFQECFFNIQKDWIKEHQALTEDESKTMQIGKDFQVNDVVYDSQARRARVMAYDPQTDRCFLCMVDPEHIGDDGWYDRKQLHPYDPTKRPPLTVQVQRAEMKAESQRDPDWCYSPCDHRSHGR